MSCGGAREKQVRHVRAGDQKKSRDGSDENHEGWADLRNGVFEHGERDAAPVRIGVRELLRVARGQCCELRLGLGFGHAGLESPDGLHVVEIAPRPVRFVGREGRPDLGLAGEREAIGHHADHIARPAADEERSAQDVRIAREALLPESAAHEHHRVLAGRELIFVEESPEHRLRAEDAREVSRDDSTFNPFRVGALSGEVEVRALPPRESFKGCGVLMNREELPGRPRGLREVRASRVDTHQPLGLLEGQRPQEHAVDDREDRGVGADAESEGQQHDRGESRRGTKLTERGGEVVHEG